MKMDMWTEYLRKYARVLWSVGEHQFLYGGDWVCGGAPYGWFLLLSPGGLVQPEELAGVDEGVL